MKGKKLLKKLSKPHTAAILVNLDQYRTVRELDNHTDVPIATLHRRVRELDDVGVLKSKMVSGTGTADAKAYKRTVRQLSINFRDEMKFEIKKRASVGEY